MDLPPASPAAPAQRRSRSACCSRWWRSGFMLIIGVMEVHQPRARLAVRARRLCGARVHLPPEACCRSRFCSPASTLPLGWRFVVALRCGAAAWSASSAWALELCLRRTYGKDPLYGLLLTFGAALVLEELIRVDLGLERAALPDARRHHRRRPDRRPDLFEVPLLRRRPSPSAMIALFWLFLERTPYGALIKAGAHDSEMVRALGVNLPRLRLFVFAFGTGARRHRRHHHGADLGRAPACRRRRGRAGLRHHRAGRRRQLLGRGASPGCWSASWSD